MAKIDVALSRAETAAWLLEETSIGNLSTAALAEDRAWWISRIALEELERALATS